jgi:transposase
VVKQKLEKWISWASRSRLPSFKKVARTIKKYLGGIIAIVATGLNNGKIEGPQWQNQDYHPQGLFKSFG